MKRLIILLCFVCLDASAQNGFFLQGDIGAGISNIKIAPTPLPLTSMSEVVGMTAAAGIGYQYRHWDARLGAAFLKTGFHLQSSDSGRLDATVFYYHVLLPLSIEYAFKVGNRVSIVPLAGAAFSYNATERETDEMRGLPVTGPAEFIWNTGLEQTSFFALAGCDLRYKFNAEVSIVAGAEWYRMITSLTNLREYYSQYNYLYTLNLGVRWLFHRQWSNNLQPEGF